MALQTLQMTWKGIRPILMHAPTTVDPLHPLTKAIKEVTSKRKKTDADHEEVSRLEWEAALYWENGVGLVVPGDLIEATIRAGAKKSRLGKEIQSAVLVDASVPVDLSECILHTPLPVTKRADKDALYGHGDFALRQPVKVTTSRVMRVRPMVPTGWKLNFKAEFDDVIINEAALRTAVRDAGALVGLGDWRPKFGRFISE